MPRIAIVTAQGYYSELISEIVRQFFRLINKNELLKLSESKINPQHLQPKNPKLRAARNKRVFHQYLNVKANSNKTFKYFAVQLRNAKTGKFY